MKLPKNFWKTVQHEYTSASPDLQTYICHCSPTFRQHYGSDYIDILCRPAIRNKARKFLQENPTLSENWTVSTQGTALFWEQWDKKAQTPRKELLTMFLAYAATTKRKQKTTKPTKP